MKVISVLTVVLSTVFVQIQAAPSSLGSLGPLGGASPASALGAPANLPIPVEVKQLVGQAKQNPVNGITGGSSNSLGSGIGGSKAIGGAKGGKGDTLGQANGVVGKLTGGSSLVF
ncbi:unnamed protein product [Cunninghamella blakesleeana]